MLRALALVLLTLPVMSPAVAQQAVPDADAAPQTEAVPDQGADATPPAPPQPLVEGPMTFPRMAAILTAIDENATVEQRGITLTVANVPVTVVVDQSANRMRVLVPISSAEGLTGDDLMRLMQANFDTALDARYAVANGRLWSTYIHPLAQLQRNQLISGIAQTVTLAQTYGDTYSSGGISFGGGDSRGLIQELLELGEEL